MNIMYKYIFLNFDLISSINKEMVSLFQLHTYKFGLVYIMIYKSSDRTPKKLRLRFYPLELWNEIWNIICKQINKSVLFIILKFAFEMRFAHAHSHKTIKRHM